MAVRVYEFSLSYRPCTYYADRLKTFPEERVWPGLVALAVGTLVVVATYFYAASLLFSGQGC